MNATFDGKVALVAGGTGALGRAVSLAFLAEGTDGVAVEALIAGIVTQHGALDVLVNRVGGFTGGKTLWGEDARVLDRMLASNLRSGYAMSRAAVPQMLERGRGARRPSP
jgi:NAD(P)-dependent dehydrogenase (short-subunit alcohol dehydrogenase family)